MTILKNIEDINKLREGGRILASVLYKTAGAVTPGIKTIELDKLADKMIKEAGGQSSFKNYKTPDDKTPYPASLCVSVNEEIVHGIPGERVLKNGDIVSLDLGMEYKGFFTDMAVTVSVGSVDQRAKKLIRTTKEALDLGIKAVRSGAFIGDIGQAIQSCAEGNGFNVVRKLVGHGLGWKAHEDPEIPNWGQKGQGEILKEGEIIAIEPMVVAGGADIYLDKDLWTWKTGDGSLSSHFEYTVIVTKKGAEIITKI